VGQGSVAGVKVRNMQGNLLGSDCSMEIVSEFVCLFVCLFVLFVEIISRTKDKIGKLSSSSRST